MQAPRAHAYTAAAQRPRAHAAAAAARSGYVTRAWNHAPPHPTSTPTTAPTPSTAFPLRVSTIFRVRRLMATDKVYCCAQGGSNPFNESTFAP